MSLQIVIGSNKEELSNLQILLNILDWSKTILDTTYGDGEYPDEVPFTADQLNEVEEWIDGINLLLTDPSIFVGQSILG